MLFFTQVAMDFCNAGTLKPTDQLEHLYVHVAC